MDEQEKIDLFVIDSLAFDSFRRCCTHYVDVHQDDTLMIMDTLQEIHSFELHDLSQLFFCFCNHRKLYQQYPMVHSS